CFCDQECLIIVLDIRLSAAEDVKLKSVKCVAEILKDKIVCDRKDHVSFVLVGCDRTENSLNAPNIVEFGNPQLCNWDLLLKLFKFVNETASEEGEWLEGLNVALALQEKGLALKPQRQRILLLFDFNNMPQDYNKFNTITDNLLEAGIELIVGSHNVSYIDNAETGTPQSIFNFSRKCGPHELENQKYALNLVPRCNATLCSFKEALRSVFKITNRRPWVWNAKLHIGSTISIQLQGMIAMKNQTPVKLEKVWAADNEVVTRETRYFLKGTEVKPLPEDLVAGYMLGGTPVPYDDALLEAKVPHPPGLHFFGFIKRDSVPDEYFCGDSLYLLVHQKENTTSAKKLDALVRALVASDRAILCWKIYSTKLNTPRMVVLLPRLADDVNPASLFMLEVSYSGQHHFWDFPALRTAKTECSEDQLQAIDRLIDSSDLECSLRDNQQPRPWPQNDLLPFDGLPSIFEQNLMDVLQHRVLRKNQDENEEQFKKLLKDKSFAEVFWSVPEPLEEKSKQAAANVKHLFPLRYSRAWLEKLKAKEQEEESKFVKPETVEKNITMPEELVGLSNPAADFKRILEIVRSHTNATEKDARFQALSAQMRVVIITLLERKNLNLELLAELIGLYRQSCIEFNAFVEYEKFAEDIKKTTLTKHLKDFWQNVMVEKQLGPLVLGEPELDDELHLNSYFTIENWNDQESAQD
ncbi:hypothetical protein KR026_000001, partial [Drosophila bipectinata]